MSHIWGNDPEDPAQPTPRAELQGVFYRILARVRQPGAVSWGEEDRRAVQALAEQGLRILAEWQFTQQHKER
jgi:hypothetical protein